MDHPKLKVWHTFWEPHITKLENCGVVLSTIHLVLGLHIFWSLLFLHYHLTDWPVRYPSSRTQPRPHFPFHMKWGDCRISVAMRNQSENNLIFPVTLFRLMDLLQNKPHSLTAAVGMLLTGAWLVQSTSKLASLPNSAGKIWEKNSKVLRYTVSYITLD